MRRKKRFWVKNEGEVSVGFERGTENYIPLDLPNSSATNYYFKAFADMDFGFDSPRANRLYAPNIPNCSTQRVESTRQVLLPRFLPY